jgi:hypothetical protein
MPTFTATFLSRNEKGQFENKSIEIGCMEDELEVESYIRHKERNGWWSIESNIEIRGPIGSQNCKQSTIHT